MATAAGGAGAATFLAAAAGGDGGGTAGFAEELTAPKLNSVPKSNAGS